MAWLGVIALVAAINWVFGIIAAVIILAVVLLLLYFALKGFDSPAATDRDDKSVAGQHSRRFFSLVFWPIRLRMWKDPDPYRTMIEQVTALDAHHGAEAREKGFRARQRRKAHDVDTHIRHIKRRA